MLQSISPIDGRYADKTASLVPFFSEMALIRYRVQVEVEYFIALCELPLPQLANFPKLQYPYLRALYQDFSLEEALKVKQIERTTNHDVKAVEYYLKEAFDRLQLQPYKEFIHFGLTSQDVNNTAIPLSLKEAVAEVYLPTLEHLLSKLKALVAEWKNIPLLARTHGQPASPTRLGKEFEVFQYRKRYVLLQ